MSKVSALDLLKFEQLLPIAKQGQTFAIFCHQSNVRDSDYCDLCLKVSVAQSIKISIC